MSGSKRRAVTREKRSWGTKVMGLIGRKSRQPAPAVAQFDGERRLERELWAGSNPEYEERTAENPLYQEQAENPLHQEQEEAGSSGSGQREAMAAFRGEGEDIRRRRKVGPVPLPLKSRDKGYRTNVADPADALAAEVDLLLRQGVALSGDTLRKAVALRDELVRQRDHYSGNLAGEKNRTKGEQRQRKIDAINRRIDGLDDLLRQADAREVAWCAIANADSGGSDEVDDTIEEMVAQHGDDPRFMEGLFSHAIGAQIQKELYTDGRPLTGKDLLSAKQQLFRINNPATKLAVEYAAKSDEGGNYLRGCRNLMKGALPPQDESQDIEPLEIDPAKVKMPEDASEQEIAEGIDRRLARLAGIVNTAMDGIMVRPAPQPISTIAHVVASSMTNEGFDEEEIAKTIGSFVMLRIVCPQFTRMCAELPANERRSVILATKAIQNLANGILDAGKEPWMQPLMDAVRGRYDEMNGWLLDIAKEGEALSQQ